MSSRKKKQLRDLVDQVHAKGRRPLSNIRELVPFQDEWLKKFYEGLPASKRNRSTSQFFRARRGRINCTQRQVQNIATEFSEHDPHGHFATLARADYFFDPIVEITPSEAEVFDLNVPEGSMFSANGFMNHNTTLARILARALLCQDLQTDGEPCNECDNCKAVLSETMPAFSELDAASKGTIDNIRSIVADLPFVIPNAPCRVYLFDEMHRMSKDSQDVLLKPVEDKKMVGIFCTTEPSKIRGTIRSRCEEYTIRKITREEVLDRMKWVLEQEKVEYEEDAVLTVVDYSEGHVRDILNRLEMIGQMGPISVSSVRDYLNLSLISTYYEVLLSLGDPNTAVQLVEQVCDRVGVDAVAGGIAEAAMNSYRLAHKMFTNFTFLDREKAEQVYEMYGNTTIKLAEHFLRSRRPTKVGLIVDVLACSGGVPAVSARAAAAAPVRVTAAIPAALPASQEPQAEQAPTVEVEVEVTTPEVEHQPVPEAAAAEREAVPESAKSTHGNLGSSDPQALTELDSQAIPTKLPRGAEREGEGSKTLFESKKRASLTTPIPPGRFRQAFSDAWLHSRGD